MSTLLQKAEFVFNYIKDKKEFTVNEIMQYLINHGFKAHKSQVSLILSVTESRYPLSITRYGYIYEVELKKAGV